MHVNLSCIGKLNLPESATASNFQRSREAARRWKVTDKTLESSRQTVVGKFPLKIQSRINRTFERAYLLLGNTRLRFFLGGAQNLS